MRPSPKVIFVKRSIDIIVGLIGTLAFLFWYPILALLIKMESAGPVLYSQERIGINQRLRRKDSGSLAPQGEDPDFPDRKSDVGGKPFMIFKFRSMRTDAEKDGPRLAS